MQPWPKEIHDHILGECRKCLAIIADHPSYGRRANRTDPTLCECCEADLTPQVNYRDSVGTLMVNVQTLAVALRQVLDSVELEQELKFGFTLEEVHDLEERVKWAYDGIQDLKVSQANEARARRNHGK